MQTGIHFLDIVHDLEKISDHCSNIAIYTIQLGEGAEEFDTHAYAKAGFRSGAAVRGASCKLSISRQVPVPSDRGGAGIK